MPTPPWAGKSLIRKVDVGQAVGRAQATVRDSLRHPFTERNLRVGLGLIGLLMLAYGAGRILEFPDQSKPLHLAKWLIVSLILHDGLFAPAVTVGGWVLSRVVRSRARAYLQGYFIVAGSTTLLALVLNHRHGTGAPGRALLTLNYARNGLILLAVVGLAMVALYALRVRRDRRTAQ